MSVSASRRFLRLTTRAGLAGGTVYVIYRAGLWKSAEETIANYEAIKKDIEARYQRLSPSLMHFVEDKASLAKKKTVDPVTESVSNFQQKWLNFDYSWIESEDGILKPAWNKGVAVVCDFVAHLPENTVDWTVRGWKYASDYMNDASIVTDTVTSGKSATPKHEQTQTGQQTQQ